MFDSKKIIRDIRSSHIASGDSAYVTASGDWTVGKTGCQPAYTQAVSRYDLELCSDSELIEQLDDFHETFSM